MLVAVVVLAACVHLRKLSPAQIHTALQLVLEEQQQTPPPDHLVQQALLIRQVLPAAAAVAGRFLQVQMAEAVEVMALKVQPLQPVLLGKEQMAECQVPE
jgi:hypothetical protein